MRRSWPKGLIGSLLAAVLAVLPAQAAMPIGSSFVRRDSAAALPAKVSSPAQLFALHCAGCHRFDGSGQPQAGVPSMRGVLGRFVRSAEGRAFLVQVPGVNNAGLSDAQIAELSNWLIRTLAADSLPANWQPYAAEELPALRAARPADLAAARRRILAANEPAAGECPSRRSDDSAAQAIPRTELMAAASAC